MHLNLCQPSSLLTTCTTGICIVLWPLPTVKSVTLWRVFTWAAWQFRNDEENFHQIQGNLVESARRESNLVSKRSAVSYKAIKHHTCLYMYTWIGKFCCPGYEPWKLNTMNIINHENLQCTCTCTCSTQKNYFSIVHWKAGCSLGTRLLSYGKHNWPVGMKSVLPWWTVQT